LFRIKTGAGILPLNLLLIALIAIIIFLPSNVLRIILGLPIVLFFPGYVLILALFPKKEGVTDIERIALSFGLSIAVVPLIGFILNYTPWGIKLYPILISLAGFILTMSGIAWYRMKNLAEDEKFNVPFKISLPSWREQKTVDKILSVALILAIAGAIGTLGYTIAKPKVGERFTEFYILGPQGKAVQYPNSLELSERGKVTLGVINHEQEELNYQVKVIMDGVEEGVKIWLEGEEGEFTSIVDNTIDVETLTHEEKWEGNILFEPVHKGEKQKLEFLLFSPKLRQNHHIRSQLVDGDFVDIIINEADGEGKITLDNNSSSPHHYSLEICQQGIVKREISFTAASGEKLEQEIQYPPGESTFQLYKDGELVLKDTGVELSLHLWVDVS